MNGCLLQLVFIVSAILIQEIYSHNLQNYNNKSFLTLKFDKRKFKENQNEKLCRFRDKGLFPVYPWDILTAGYCYIYTDPNRMNVKYPTGETLIPGTNYSVPFGVATIENKTIPFLFDLKHEVYSKIIKDSFKSKEYLNKYLDCCDNAINCCNNAMNNENIYPTEEYPCTALWDGWSCIEKTKKHEIAYQTCPTYIYSSESISCIAQSEKYCLETDWNQETNYETCTFGSLLRKRHRFHIIALSISTVLIIPSLLIFICFRKFNSGKLIHVALHRNLLLSVVIRNILTITSKSAVILDAILIEGKSNNILVDNPVGCRILAFLENVSKNAIFTCMLVDAFYLHKLIVRSFAPDPKLYVLYIVTMVFSIVPSLTWAILMASTNMEHCWMVDDVTWYQWITDGYKYVILVLNTLLLIHILVVLFIKCGKNSTKQQTKSTLRATLFMLPLFGIPHLLTAQRSMVDISLCANADIYYHVIYSIDAVQGLLVAILFCYMNGEVQNELKKLYNRLRTHLQEKFNIGNTFPDIKRATTLTTVASSQRSTSIKEEFPRSENQNLENWMSENIYAQTNDNKH